jgi:hypothetical protein
VAQKSITEKEHSPYSPDLAPNDFWLFPEINSTFKGTKTFKKCDDDTESYSTTGKKGKVVPVL